MRPRTAAAAAAAKVPDVAVDPDDAAVETCVAREERRQRPGWSVQAALDVEEPRFAVDGDVECVRGFLADDDSGDLLSESVAAVFILDAGGVDESSSWSGRRHERQFSLGWKAGS